MSSIINRISSLTVIGRAATIAGLMAATMLTSPLTQAWAETSPRPSFNLVQAAPPQVATPPVVAPQAAAPLNRAAAGATEAKGETVEQRITNLHAALKITPDQDAAWKGVAQAMRENAANMDKLIATTRTTPPQNMTAMQDLASYQKFAQAHVDGLKNLISSFGTLYSAMPDAQKKIADDVFNAPEPRTAASRG